MRGFGDGVQESHSDRHASAPTINESWLQQRLADEPTLLGLGDLTLRDRERRQPGAGRLDLLLTDEESDTRFEVEIQLGPTNPSHIIRTIEYWDLERRRYPQYYHVAVLVAEDVTSRFLNIISLFNGFIPIIAIQIRCVEVNDVVTLFATHVVDLIVLGTDEEDEIAPVADRAYWESRSSNESLEVMDAIFEIVRHFDPSAAFYYTRSHVGLTRNGIVDNFIRFRPRKSFVSVNFRINRTDELDALVEASDLDALPYNNHTRRYRVRARRTDLTQSREQPLELTQAAFAQSNSWGSPVRGGKAALLGSRE